MTETILPSETVAAPSGMKAFLIIWLGELISILGSGLTSFGLGVYIYQKTGQATPFALTVLFSSLPMILLLPVAGSLADRWNRRWIMILADTGAALVTACAALLLFFGELQIWHIYLIALFGSVCGAFQEPAYMASITMLVPKKELARASGMVQMGQAIQTIITPLLGGLLFVLIKMQGIILIDFITFFFAIGALWIVGIPQPPKQTVTEAAATGARNQVWNDVVFAWKYIRARSGLLGLLLYFAMVNFLLNLSTVLVSPLVLSRYLPSVLGVVETVTGVGMLAGGITLSAWGGPKSGRRIPLVIAIIGAAMVGLILAGIQPQPFFICAGMFLLLFLIPMASGLNQAVWQTKIAPDIQGRVLSVRGLISRSMMPVAFLIAGPMADRLFGPWMQNGGALANTFVGALLQTGAGRGIGLIFVLAGLAGILVTLLVFANPHIRLLEDELPDAVTQETRELLLVKEQN